MIKTLLFDMAATRVDEDNMVYQPLQQALKNAGNDFSLETVLRDG